MKNENDKERKTEKNGRRQKRTESQINAYQIRKLNTEKGGK